MMKLIVPNGARQVDVSGFSAGSYTGLAVHSVLSDFACFPGDTKVAAIAAPPELMRLATGERKVTLLHCVEDGLCVWRHADPTELGYNLILLEGSPEWRMATCSLWTWMKAPIGSINCKSLIRM